MLFRGHGLVDDGMDRSQVEIGKAEVNDIPVGSSVTVFVISQIVDEIEYD